MIVPTYSDGEMIIARTIGSSSLIRSLDSGRSCGDRISRTVPSIIVTR